MKPQQFKLGFLLTILVSCTTPSSAISEITSVSSFSTEFTFSSEANSLSSVSSLSASIPSVTSNDSSSSLLSNSSESISSSLTPVLASIWLAPMNLNNATLYYGINQTLTPALSTRKITLVQAIYTQDGTIYGYAYEAQVDGNGGSNSIRFRVGLTANLFAGFTMVSHREHAGFGVKIINALVNQLPGKPATAEAIQNILINANATSTGITETYDGMIPALEAIILHYFAQIE